MIQSFLKPQAKPYLTNEVLLQSRDFPSNQGGRPSNDNSWGQNPAAPQPGYNSSATGNRPNQPPVRPSYQTGNSYQTGSSNNSNASNTGGYNQYVGPKGNSGGGGYQTGRSTDTSGKLYF